jgi:uncharacterized protein YndB with AHSA1/START domain
LRRRAHLGSLCIPLPSSPAAIPQAAAMTETAAPPQIVLTRHYAATPERMFDAWLTPHTLGMWMFGQVADERVLGLDIDPRVGGRFSLRVERGGRVIHHVGRFLRLVRPELLEFTWGMADDGEDPLSVVRLELTAAGDYCRLNLTHTLDPRWAASLERTRQGWNTLLDALGELFPDFRGRRPGAAHPGAG